MLGAHHRVGHAGGVRLPGSGVPGQHPADGPVTGPASDETRIRRGSARERADRHGLGTDHRGLVTGPPEGRASGARPRVSHGTQPCGNRTATGNCVGPGTVEQARGAYLPTGKLYPGGGAGLRCGRGAAPGREATRGGTGLTVAHRGGSLAHGLRQAGGHGLPPHGQAGTRAGWRIGRTGRRSAARGGSGCSWRVRTPQRPAPPRSGPGGPSRWCLLEAGRAGARGRGRKRRPGGARRDRTGRRGDGDPWAGAGRGAGFGEVLVPVRRRGRAPRGRRGARTPGGGPGGSGRAGRGRSAGPPSSGRNPRPSGWSRRRSPSTGRASSRSHGR